MGREGDYNPIETIEEGDDGLIEGIHELLLLLLFFFKCRDEDNGAPRGIARMKDFLQCHEREDVLVMMLMMNGTDAYGVQWRCAVLFYDCKWMGWRTEECNCNDNATEEIN